MSEFSKAIREMFGESDRKRDEELTSPHEIQRFDDIVYGIDQKWQVLDLYRPKKEEKRKMPVIISVHGGAWVYGKKENYQFYCMELARRGFAVINFSYRLAPEVKFPASIEDINLVCKWIMEHSEEYFLETDHIYAVGDSAGAHMLGIYASICTNDQYAARFSFTPPYGFRLNAIALNCGAYNFRTENGLDEFTLGLMHDFLEQGGTADELEFISVTDHITAGFPPVFVMTSVEDFMKDQAPVLAASLIKNDIPFVYKVYGDEKNRLGHVFNCDIRSKAATLCNDDECNFFKAIDRRTDKKKTLDMIFGEYEK